MRHPGGFWTGSRRWSQSQILRMKTEERFPNLAKGLRPHLMIRCSWSHGQTYRSQLVACWFQVLRRKRARACRYNRSRVRVGWTVFLLRADGRSCPEVHLSPTSNLIIRFCNHRTFHFVLRLSTRARGFWTQAIGVSPADRWSGRTGRGWIQAGRWPSYAGFLAYLIRESTNLTCGNHLTYLKL